MLSDISGKPCIKDSDLSLYCYRVAGVVGLLSIEIFGYQNRHARDFATSLGEALQLTNILRDIQEDMQRGRIYLPQTMRAKFKVSDQDVFEGLMNENMRQLLQYYVEKAEKNYQQALQQLPLEDRASLRPALIMAAIYYAQLERMRRFNFDVWKHSARISSWRKIRIAWKTWRYEKKFEKTSNLEKYPLKLNF